MVHRSRGRLAAVVLSAVTLSGLAEAAQHDDKIDKALRIFNRAKYLHQEKRYEEAIREYRAAAKLDEENPWIWNSLGLALTAKREFKSAIKAFERALQLNPELTDVYNNLGVVYAEMGRREKAFEAFSRVIADPTYPTPEKALYNLGELYVQQRNYELALLHFRRSVEKNERFAMGHRGMGIALLGLGEVEDAEASFEKALELNEKDVQSLYELARIHEKKGQLDRAREYYRRVVEVDRLSVLGRLSLRRLDALESSD